MTVPGFPVPGFPNQLPAGLGILPNSLPATLIAPTSASSDTTAACSRFSGEVDVVELGGLQWITVRLHDRIGKELALPRFHRRAPHHQKRRKYQRRTDVTHYLGSPDRIIHGCGSFRSRSISSL